MNLTHIPYLPPSIIPIEIKIEGETHQVAQIDVPGECTKQLQREAKIWQQVFEYCLPIVYALKILNDNNQRRKKARRDQPNTSDVLIAYLRSGDDISVVINDTAMHPRSLPSEVLKQLESANEGLQKIPADGSVTQEQFAHAIQILERFVTERCITLKTRAFSLV